MDNFGKCTKFDILHFYDLFLQSHKLNLVYSGPECTGKVINKLLCIVPFGIWSQDFQLIKIKHEEISYFSCIDQFNLLF